MIGRAYNRQSSSNAPLEVSVHSLNADGHRAQVFRPGRPSRRHRPASCVVTVLDDEIEQGGRGGRLDGQKTSQIPLQGCLRSRRRRRGDRRAYESLVVFQVRSSSNPAHPHGAGTGQR